MTSRLRNGAPRPPRHGEAWTVEDDDYLRAHHRSEPTTAIAAHLQRTPGTVSQRITTLHLNEREQLACLHCGTPLTAAKVGRPPQWCAQHSEPRKRQPPTPPQENTLTCITCGATFTTTRPRARHCSRACNKRAYIDSQQRQREAVQRRYSMRNPADRAAINAMINDGVALRAIERTTGVQITSLSKHQRRLRAQGARAARGVYWSPEDDAYLRAHYRNTARADIARELQRTPAAITSRITTLRLAHANDTTVAS